MQAGLARWKLRFRDILTAAHGALLFALAGTRSAAYDQGEIRGKMRGVATADEGRTRRWMLALVAMAVLAVIVGLVLACTHLIPWDRLEAEKEPGGPTMKRTGESIFEDDEEPSETGEASVDAQGEGVRSSEGRGTEDDK